MGGGTPEASIEAGKEYTNADSIKDLSGSSGTQTLVQELNTQGFLCGNQQGKTIK